MTFMRWAIAALITVALLNALLLSTLASHIVDLHNRISVLEYTVDDLIWANITRNYVRDARWTDRFGALSAKVNWYIIQRSGLAELNRADALLGEDP